ncbi:MAG: DNA-binding transcriptional regulator [Planctomycetota bacterium]
MKRHVALMIETSSAYGREVLSGVVRFMRMHDQWSVFLEQSDLSKKPPSWLASWHGDGIISRVTTPRLLKTLQATGVPLVDLTDRHDETTLPQVRSDDDAIGRLAARHLLERGFRQCGFCGFSREAWSQRREFAFVDEIESEGGTCRSIQSPWHGPGVSSWEAWQNRLAQWLKEFDGPAGIMACNDLRGQQVLDACGRIGVAVPEKVAVIGVDDDELLCRLCTPPMSSVVPNAAGVGFHAAQQLAQLMDGASRDDMESIQVSPLGVTTRQSTDVVAIDDIETAAALKYIRENACHGISVDDVTKNVALSRSKLERDLRKHLGRTPQQEIRFTQVKRAKELLATTDLSIDQISRLCSFQSAEYMHVVFKRFENRTPGAFRRSALQG